MNLQTNLKSPPKHLVHSGLMATCVALLGLTAPTYAQPPTRAVQSRLTRMPLRSTLDPRPTRAAVASPSHAVKRPQDFTVFDAPGAGTGAGQGTISYDTNNSGVSTGVYFDSSSYSHGFVRAVDGMMTTFDVDGSLSETFPTWMSDAGTVVGFYYNANAGITDCFLRKPRGRIVTFDALGGNSTYTLCNGISDSGVVVGNYGDSSGDHGFLRAKDGTITSFDAPGAAGTLGDFLNSDGTAVGAYYDSTGVNHAYIRSPGGSFTEFDAAGAGTSSGQGTFAIGINNSGSVCGDFIDSNGAHHAFVRNTGGTITEFDAPDAGTADGQGTEAISNNNHGYTTGWYVDSNNVFHGYVRAKNGAITEFDAPGAGTNASQGTQGFSINKHNVIGGWEVDESGVNHGIIRTP